MTLRRSKALAFILLLLVSGPSAAAPALDRLVIIVPASAGGGFDRTAQSVARALRADHIVRNVQIRRSPGAGGLIALAQLEGQPALAAPTILIGGVTMLGAEAENHSLVSLADLAPICQLTDVALAIAVRNDSSIRSASDLLEIMKTDPDGVTWIGGSPGSADEVLLWAMAAKLGVAHDRFRFVAVPGGGDQVLDRLAAEPQFVAIRSFEEFASYPGRSKLRLLATATDQRFPGITLPTLREIGFDLVITDWKGAFVSLQTPESQRRALRIAFERMLASPAWSREIAAQKWRAPAQPFEGFEAKIASDRRMVRALVSQPVTGSPWDSRLRDLLNRPWRYALALLAVAALLVLAVLWQRRAARAKDHELRRALETLEEIRTQMSDAGDAAEQGAAGERTAIARQMQVWGLSSAEIEIGWLILKGLQFKDIASARGTSERTVRQQAQMIYAKSGIPNRSEFAAYFLEDLRF